MKKVSIAGILLGTLLGAAVALVSGSWVLWLGAGQVIRFNAEQAPFRMAWVLVPVILLMVLVGFYVSTARPRPKKIVGTRNVSYLTRMWRNYGVTGEGINTSPGQLERSS